LAIKQEARAVIRIALLRDSKLLLRHHFIGFPE
jgi:hypothetical protein